MHFRPASRRSQTRGLVHHAVELVWLRPAAPNRLRGPDDDLELAALVLDRNAVSQDRRRETALRTQRQTLEGDDAARLSQAPFEALDGLHPRRLRRDEAEDHRLVLRDLPQRVERAGALVIVLEEETLGADVAEDRARDRVVRPGREPAASLVPAAEVEAEGDARMTADHRVVHRDAVGEPAREAPAPRLVEGPRPLVEQERVVWRVELDVERTPPDQLRDLGAQDVDDVGEKGFERGIDRARRLGRPEVREQARARQRDLRHPRGVRREVRELVHREVAPAGELAYDAERLRPREAPISHLRVAAPLAPEEGIEVVAAEAIDRLRHPALEGEAPHLAVGYDLEACLLLQPDGGVDRRVLDGAKLHLRDAARRPVGARA